MRENSDRMQHISSHNDKDQTKTELKTNLYTYGVMTTQHNTGEIRDIGEQNEVINKGKKTQEVRPIEMHTEILSK